MPVPSLSQHKALVGLACPSAFTVPSAKLLSAQPKAAALTNIIFNTPKPCRHQLSHSAPQALWTFSFYAKEDRYSRKQHMKLCAPLLNPSYKSASAKLTQHHTASPDDRNPANFPFLQTSWISSCPALTSSPIKQTCQTVSALPIA